MIVHVTFVDYVVLLLFALPYSALIMFLYVLFYVLVMEPNNMLFMEPISWGFFERIHTEWMKIKKS